MKRLALIDCGAGNLHSAHKAFQHLGAPLGFEVVITQSAAEVAKAERIVLPGDGAFGSCMDGLRALPDMVATLNRRVRDEGVPFFGICVGMQLMFERSHEFGMHEGLGWLPGEVVKLHAPAGEKVPHMGWNELQLLQPTHPLLNGIEAGQHAYFVHSYHAQCPQDVLIATTDFGGAVTAMAGKGVMVGAQFHPEKSQATGLRMIENFLRMEGGVHG